jgi:hypothetical protein
VNIQRLYTVTYTQEATQPVRALTIADAAVFARKYAADHGMRLLSVEPAASVAVPP